MAAEFIDGRVPFLAAVLVLIATTASAQSGPSPGVGFGLVGISGGQSARLNALNQATSAPTDPDTSCGVTLQFLDLKGQVQKVMVVTLQPGHAASLELRRDELPSGADPRVDTRAVLLFGYSGGAPPSPAVLRKFNCNIVPSLEVIDSESRRTVIILTEAKRLQSPTPAQ